MLAVSEGRWEVLGRAYDVAEGVAVPGMVLARALDTGCENHPFNDSPEGCTVTVACGVAIAVAVAQRIA